MKDNSGHSYSEGGEVPKLTKRDLMKLTEAQDKAAKEWNRAFDYRAIRNGVQVGNIKMHHFDEVNRRAMEIYASTGSVAAPKPDEEKETVENLAALWIDGLTPCCPNNPLNKLRLIEDITAYVNQELSPIQSELAAAKESIKELLPILEYYCNNAPPKKWAWGDILSRAKALLEH